MVKNWIQRAMIICLLACLTGCRGADGSSQETTILTVPVTESIEVIPPATQETIEPTIQETVEPTTQETELALSLPEPEDGDFVRVKDYIPDVVVDLRYASENNFTGQRIYDFTELWLRYGTVKKLVAVQKELRKEGLYLKVWDGFRPTAAQFKLWEVYPDATYVANPNNGFSSHSRGNTVDVTLVNEDGMELAMPTGFDDFSKLADRDYSDCTQETADNARFLEHIMTEYGFKPYAGEWWHFSDTQSYPVEQEFLSVA